jgi:hypothetical protein
MIRAKQNHIYKSHALVEGDPYPMDVSKEEQERLIRIGLAEEVPMPNMDNTKYEIKDYMDRHGIDYTTSMTKKELLDEIIEHG